METIFSSNRNVSVIGLGYVGLPVAVAFGKYGRVIGFDINPIRISELKRKGFKAKIISHGWNWFSFSLSNNYFWIGI